MSTDSGSPRDRTERRENDDLPPLPAWNAGSGRESSGAKSPPGTSSSPKVPPYSPPRSQHQAPELETILKAIGVVLVISALVVGAFIARPGGGGQPAATATSEAAVVIASGEAEALEVSGTPETQSGFDARNSEVTVCIDPGHGGIDMGYQRTATSAVPAMDESYFNLAIAKDLEQRLKEQGFDVVLTRTDDHEVNITDLDANNDGQIDEASSTVSSSQDAASLDEMQTRIDVCNDNRADILISLHVDGSPDPNVRGSRVWYSDERSFAQENQVLANLIFEELETQMRAVGYPWVGQGVFTVAQIAAENEHGQLQRLLVDDERPELKEPSAMPGAIVEVLTLTSDADATFLSSEQGVASISLALDKAIIQFVETSLRGTG